MENITVRCPKCAWEPDGKPHWSCSCGMQWDTFSTGGRCPKCGKVWSQTQCVEPAGGCNLWSPHLDWYENLDEISEEALSLLKECKV